MYEQIVDALNRGDTAAAIPGIKAALQTDPGNAELHHMLGLCLQRAGDAQGARQAIAEALALAPENAGFHLSYAALDAGQNKLVAAEQGMQRAVALDPNNLLAYVSLIHLALGRKDFEKANDYLKLVRRVDDQAPQVLIAEGRVADMTGQPDRALQYFTAAVQKDPGNASAFIMIGLAYLQRDMAPFAEQALRRALAIRPSDPGALRALVSAQQKQGLVKETLETLDTLVSLFPASKHTRAQRASLRETAGQPEAALDDCLVLCEQSPTDVPVLTAAALLLTRLGRSDQAIALVEKALALSGQSDALWLLGVDLAWEDLSAAIGMVHRWLAQLPQSALAHEKLALYQEAAGDLDGAKASAAKAIAIDHRLPMAQFVLVRAELRDNPAQALERLETLEAVAVVAESQRMVLAWRGLVLDRLSDYPGAANAFREMALRPLPQHPLPAPAPAVASAKLGLTGRLLWAPVGVHAAPVLSALRALLGDQLLEDRQHADIRGDGFGRGRPAPDDSFAGTADRWLEGLRVLGHSAEQAVDCLPFWDAYTGAALQGATLVAILLDPRDAFLNWMVFGSVQSYGFLPEPKHSADWLALSLEALADSQANPAQSVVVIPIDGLPAEADDIGQALKQALALAQSPSSEALSQPFGHHGGGIPSQFPVGHWRKYREVFSEEFARLTPVAVRLGYLAD